MLRVRAALVVTGALMCVATTIAPVEAGKKSRVSTLGACPAWGAETRGMSRGLLNEVKRRFPAGSSPVRLDFSDFATLQQQADAVVRSGPNVAFPAAQRAKLHGLRVGDRRVSEGDLVALAGFVTGKPDANASESVNCYLRGPANNDFEIAAAPRPRASPRDAVIVEMIPQSRPKEWTLTRLRRLAAEDRQVLIVGQLMFDSHHTLGDEPRLSLWEIHPVTRFLVCQRADNTCDPDVDDQWRSLETIAER